MKRLMLLQTMEAPSISDVKRNFGDDFAEKFFCNCDPNFREDFGLQPPLKGPNGRDLWTSPSDLLIGKVCLKPPLTSKHVRALTHQGIMDIGMKLEKLFWNQLEIEKSKELEEQHRTLKLLSGTSEKKAITEIQSKMMEIFRRQRLDLINEMDELCKQEMKRMEVKYCLDLKKELKEQARKLEQRFQSKLEEKASKTSEMMTIQSSANLEELEACMKKSFQAQLHKANILARFEIQKEQTKTKEKISALHHDLECRNLANLMYLICMERKKSTFEKNNTEQKLSHEIRKLSDTLRTKEEEIENIKVERDKHKKQVELREKALVEIIKEFQKFINFALKSAPKQAEYLLCPEKLMVFELADALSKVEVPEDQGDDHDRNYLWDRTPDMSESSEGSLRVKDGHDCLKQPEISESELSVGQFLPGFYYNDQLFVREDFRDMISQGITINENDILWTKHVQDVMDRLQQSCQSCMFNDNKDNKPPEKRRSIVSYQSSVHFSMKSKGKHSVMSVEKDKRFKRTSLKPVEPEEVLQTIDFGNIGSEENKKTLISARNSVEVLKDMIVRRRSSIKCEEIMKQKQPEKEIYTVEDLTLEKEIPSKPHESKLNLEAKDSLIRTKVHQMMGPASDLKIIREAAVGRKSERKDSKLIMANDSIEVIKRRESAPTSSKVQPDECFPTECNDMKYNSSSEVTKIDEDRRNEIENQLTSEAPKRMSISFTGKSIIFEKKEDNDGESKSKEEYKKFQVQKQKKKYKNAKSHTSKNKVSGRREPVIHTQVSREGEEVKRDKTTWTPEMGIIGSSNMKFLDQTNEHFTSDRILSFLDMLKSHPNLIRLFTSVTR